MPLFTAAIYFIHHCAPRASSFRLGNFDTPDADFHISNFATGSSALHSRHTSFHDGYCSISITTEILIIAGCGSLFYRFIIAIINGTPDDKHARAHYEPILITRATVFISGPIIDASTNTFRFLDRRWKSIYAIRLLYFTHVSSIGKIYSCKSRH
jgi:hypothetical protein